MPASERNVLVLQGGGALGAYQAGAYCALAADGIEPDWVAGISIGAINAAIISGNPPDRRRSRLRTFWEGVTAGLTFGPLICGAHNRRIYNEIAAAFVMTAGAPGFFRPRPPSAFLPGNHTLSVYDTCPLAATLGELVDFDYLNERGPRLSVGAVDVQSGNFAYFDSRSMRIGPDHVMASGALPPGFAPIEIAGRYYWDGGLVSNTPLQFVMEYAGDDPLCVFQIDLFSARDGVPRDLIDVAQREKDIRYSSRTRLTTDRYRQLHALRAAADRLAHKLPDNMRSDPDLDVLRSAGPGCPLTLVHLIHRKTKFESQSKDYEFSRLSMTEHWAAGERDVRQTLSHESWKNRAVEHDGLRVFDLGVGSLGLAPEGDTVNEHA